MRSSTLVLGPLVVVGSLALACGSSSSKNGGDGAGSGSSGGGSSGGTASSSGGGTGSSSGGASAEGGAGGDAGGGSDGGAPIGRTMGYFLGLNGFIDDPTSLLSAIGNVREYHDWQWTEGNGDPSYPGYPNNP
ncbi:MAG TPA: hypothetical protein VIF09_25080, partial [Polyangiaceae bacterium]